MACSKFEYVKGFEKDDTLLPDTYIVCRIDGRGFTKIATMHNFDKPNDDRALMLMTQAAVQVMRDFSDVVIAYGQSDEYSFVLRPSANLFNRRESKILTSIVSLFTAAYVRYWEDVMHCQLLKLPTFDGRIILYPQAKHVKDYLAWRQADCHINNLFNYCFWELVKRGQTRQDVYERLKTTFSADKNEILFTECGINYNGLPLLHRKGSTIYRAQNRHEGPNDNALLLLHNFQADEDYPLPGSTIVITHQDIIGQNFWKNNLTGI